MTYCWEVIKAGAGAIAGVIRIKAGIGAGVIRTGVLILLYSLPCRSLVG